MIQGALLAELPEAAISFFAVFSRLVRLNTFKATVLKL
jgi:hypothetical protein